MKKIVILCALLLGAMATHAQSTLAYSNALIVSNTVETVPEGKVWKVTSVYGIALNQCVNMSSTFGLDNYSNSGRHDSRVNMSAFDVNGNRVYSIVEHKARIWCTTNSNCSSACAEYTQENRGTVIPTNPNILPMWLPAGTTLNTNASNVFLSVLEFDVQ